MTDCQADTSPAKHASLVTGRQFPYGWPGGHVCYIEHAANFPPEQIRTRDAMASAIARSRSGASMIYAVWPSEYRSDLFLIDDVDALAAKTVDTRKR